MEDKNTLKNILTMIVEPIALGMLALLFIIPAITVINLQPITQKLKDLNVLGANVKSKISINPIGGTHSVIQNENTQEVDSTYRYTTELQKREANSYSKPILEITNNKENKTAIEIYGSTQIPTGSKIGLIINDQYYNLQNQNGDTQTQRIVLIPKEKYTIFLKVESFSSVQFEEDFDLEIKEVL